jgi:hypothetical protein
LMRPPSPVLGGVNNEPLVDGAVETAGGGGGTARPDGPVAEFVAEDVDDALGVAAVDALGATPFGQVTARSCEPALPAMEAMIVALPAVDGAVNVVVKAPLLVVPVVGDRLPEEEYSDTVVPSWAGWPWALRAAIVRVLVPPQVMLLGEAVIVVRLPEVCPAEAVFAAWFCSSICWAFGTAPLGY